MVIRSKLSHFYRSWDYAEALIAKGIDRSSAQRIVTETFDRFHEKGCFEVEPVEGAVESVLKLYESGSEIRIVTGRRKTKTCEELTRQWLKRLSILDSWLVMEDNKAAMCYSWSCLIDDAPHHAKDVADAGTRVYLFDYPWNRNINNHPLITRVKDWQEITVSILKQYDG